ncbi:MAG: Phage portal protein [Methanobacterium sp. PtaB.Bin024]|nr:MAG: Phage portal protein [Methanobacterium sp. PtaB.Bin024]
MSILQTIQKALPFQITRKPGRKQNIGNAGYGWMYPYLAMAGNYGTDRQKSARVTWSTYYSAMKTEIIYSCIHAYVVETLSANFDVYSDDKDTDDPDIVNYITDFYQRPAGSNEHEDYTNYISKAIQSHQGTGDFFAEVSFDDTIRGLPVGQYFIQPHRMMYHYDTDQYGLIGTNIRYEPDELIHVMIPDITNELWGQSPIDICAKSIMMDINARNFNNDFFEAKMDPRGAFEFDKEMKDDDVRTAVQLMKEQAKENPRGHITLHGAKYQKVTQSNRDLEFTTLLNMMRDRCIMTYQVPPKLVGVKDGGQLGGKGDSEEDMKLFKKRLQGRIFKPFESEFKRVLGSAWKSFGWDEEFHFGVIDLEDKMQRVNIENIRLRNGSLVVNEVKTGYGEDPVEWGDEPLSYAVGNGGYLQSNGEPTEPVKQIERDTFKVKSILREKGYLYD